MRASGEVSFLLVIVVEPICWPRLSYGDTAMIAGVGHGVVLGSFLDPAVATNIPLPWLEGKGIWSLEPV